MQRALVHFSGGTYDEFVVRDQHLRCFIRRANTADLLKNTEYSPELIRTLHSKYASWVLILTDTDALLVGYSVNGGALAHGKTDNIVDWVRDVTTRAPSNPIENVNPEILTVIYVVLSIRILLNYLYDFNCMPQLSGYEVLHPVQTDNGVLYWCCFLPPESIE